MSSITSRLPAQEIGLRTRSCYLPVIDAKAGMVLGAAVGIVKHRILRYALPAGHTLTRDNLRQLAAHQAEFVYVVAPETRSDEEIAADFAQATRSVVEIFADADLGNPTLAALLDQILAYRST